MVLDFIFPLCGWFSRRCPKATELVLKGIGIYLLQGKMGKRIRTAMASAGVDPALARQNLFYLLGLVRDFLYVRFHPDPWEILERRVEVHGLDILGRFQGKGAILLALHKGNFPWAFARLAKEVRLNVVLRRFKEPWLDAMVKEALSLAGIRGIRPEGATLKVREALRSGGVVVYLVDQYFLGLSREERSLRLHRVLSLFSSRYGTPLLPLNLSHCGDKVLVYLLQPLDSVEEGTLREWIQEEIYKEPHLWLWWYRLGKRSREGKGWPFTLRKPEDKTPRPPSKWP